MTVKVNIGHIVTNTIEYLDQRGNPMLTVVTPDVAPAWTFDDATGQPIGGDTLIVSADGLTAKVRAADAGTDTLGLSVTVGGKTYQASISIEIDPEPQVLGGVQIVSTVA